MKRLLLVIPILLSFSCSDDINVTIVRELGSVAGRVYPINSGATVGLYQGIVHKIRESKTSSDGSFRIDSVQSGDYLLRISAPDFGSYEIEGISVGEGEARDVGEIVLSLLPWPFYDSNVEPNEQNVSIRQNIVFYSTKILDEDSAESAITVTPIPLDLSINYRSYTFYGNPEISVFGIWDYLTKYEIILGSGIKTELGREIEFPWSHVIKFEQFKVTDTSFPRSD